jgi:hypothetical protein
LEVGSWRLDVGYWILAVGCWIQEAELQFQLSSIIIINEIFYFGFFGVDCSSCE